MGSIRNFNDRPVADQRWLLQHTWCETCQTADLGLRDPVEYEDLGRIFIKGKCVRCGSVVSSEIEER
jgi:hypothetical protein